MTGNPDPFSGQTEITRTFPTLTNYRSVRFGGGAEVTAWRIMEAYAIDLLSGGLVLVVLAWIWLLVRAFQQHIWWGLASLFLPPLALLFALRHAQKAVGPLVLFVLGGMVAAAPSRLFTGGAGRLRTA